MAKAKGAKVPIRPLTPSPVNALEITISNPDPSVTEKDIQKSLGFTFSGTYNNPSSGGSVTLYAWIRDSTAVAVNADSITFPASNVWNAKFNQSFTAANGHGEFLVKLIWTENPGGTKDGVNDFAYVNISN
jgi:hypothetical protein